jgi:hypothetical protein
MVSALYVTDLFLYLEPLFNITKNIFEFYVKIEVDVTLELYGSKIFSIYKFERRTPVSELIEIC